MSLLSYHNIWISTPMDVFIASSFWLHELGQHSVWSFQHICLGSHPFAWFCGFCSLFWTCSWQQDFFPLWSYLFSSPETAIPDTGQLLELPMIICSTLCSYRVNSISNTRDRVLICVLVSPDLNPLTLMPRSHA